MKFQIKKIVFVIAVLIFACCQSTKNLTGKIYELSDNEQEIKISFLSDTKCRVEQSYKCENLPDSSSHSLIEANYNVATNKIRDGKGEILKVNIIIFENTASSVKSLPNYTYIPNYEKLCLVPVSVNSQEYKRRQKLVPGVILNLIKDSIQIKNDTIFFGYKRVGRKL